MTITFIIHFGVSYQILLGFFCLINSNRHYRQYGAYATKLNSASVTGPGVLWLVWRFNDSIDVSIESLNNVNKNFRGKTGKYSSRNPL
ncbi:hypothetical protein RvY_06667 [Ramazzottius varieornatus]|uniref:Uncharacterized protein n=1 Tax=Ramazzottius varieornatus TaxID=947166 RepID=A0A1D1V823_RAMVA|nr:hypothetical protein RvY_06667 [Ramazzottius varieornatus]